MITKQPLYTIQILKDKRTGSIKFKYTDNPVHIENGFFKYDASFYEQIMYETETSIKNAYFNYWV